MNDDEGTVTFLNQKEVAARARVNVRTVQRWSKRGALRCSKHGRIVRYHVDDVDAFLRANSTLTSEGASPPAAPPSATP